MSFKITVEPTEHTFIAEAGETVLDAALRHGLAFPYGCRNGGCGACRGKIVEGSVSYPGGRPSGISMTEEAIGQALLCQAVPESDLVIEVHEIGASSEQKIRKFPTKVTAMERLAEDVMRVWLKLPDGERMQFLAGQYVDIILLDGRRRSFSLANAPHDDERLELHIRRVENGEFTGYVFEKMQEKHIVRIEGPFGNFFLREESSRPLLFVAGGTGFAPIKGIIEHAIQEEVTRPMSLYWGARDEQDLYLDSVAQAWAQREGFSYVPVLSAQAADSQWSGRTGFVHEAVLADIENLKEYDVYVAGPPAMVEAARNGFFAKGLPKEQFFFDSFDFAPAGA